MDYTRSGKQRLLFGLTILIGLGGALFIAPPAVAQEADEAQAKTAADPAIPTDELGLMVRPMTKDELVVEADAWLGLVKAKVAEISAAEIKVKQANRKIDEAEDASTNGEQAESAAHAAEKEAAAKDAVKLRDERQALIDRLNIVVNELEKKGGDPAPYETYVTAVAGLAADVDVSDVSVLWTTVQGWLKSKEGGIRWGKNIALFLITLFVAWIVARIAANAVSRALAFTKGTSDLLKEFLVSFVRRIVLIAGLLVALTMLEISVGPVLGNRRSGRLRRRIRSAGDFEQLRQRHHDSVLPTVRCGRRGECRRCGRGGEVDEPGVDGDLHV